MLEPQVSKHRVDSHPKEVVGTTTFRRSNDWVQLYFRVLAFNVAMWSLENTQECGTTELWGMEKKKEKRTNSQLGSSFGKHRFAGSTWSRLCESNSWEWSSSESCWRTTRRKHFVRFLTCDSKGAACKCIPSLPTIKSDFWNLNTRLRE